MVHDVNWARNHRNVNTVMVRAWKRYQLDHLLCDRHADIAREPANTINIRAWNAMEKDKM